ncbi:MAG: fumarylacetoacetate hydrolase family protein [Clostridia bacterium]|nr:fumarylacetoacetate hydrolase family protein [Clostridia bacterium]MBR6890381.1 fumarylacetoacetate hydrolase family protein [Clostridia bacterium]
MKLVTFIRRGGSREEVGLWVEAGVVPVRELGLPFESMNDLILGAGPEDLARLREAGDGESLPMDGVTLLAPIPRPLQDVLCLGLNYTEHAEEAFGYSSQAFSADRAVPIFFSKRASWCQGSGCPIPAHRDLTQRLDFENELAVILGRDAVNVAEADVPDYIFGYTIVNDVSARDLQTSHRQWYFGKSLDGFTPMGPCIVTADEIAWPPALAISTEVNGELRQNSNTRMLIHGIAEIVSTLSRGMTLKAGTIIATGTPKGVIMGMDNPRFLVPGDRIACRIEGIGELVNSVE